MKIWWDRELYLLLSFFEGTSLMRLARSGYTVEVAGQITVLYNNEPLDVDVLGDLWLRARWICWELLWCRAQNAVDGCLSPTVSPISVAASKSMIIQNSLSSPSTVMVMRTRFFGFASLWLKFLAWPFITLFYVFFWSLFFEVSNHIFFQQCEKVTPKGTQKATPNH